MKKLHKLLTDYFQGGDETNYFIIVDDPYYIQVLCPLKGPKIFIDAVSNAHLTSEELLNADQTQKIQTLGLVEDPKSHNFAVALDYSLDEIPKIVDLLTKLMEIYQMNPNSVEIETDDD